MPDRRALASLAIFIVVLVAAMLPWHGPAWAAGAAGLAAGVCWLLFRGGATAGPAQARLDRLEAATSSLRHDLRGILSPALLTADRLAQSSDPAQKHAGEAMIRTVDRATARLAETLDDEARPADPAPGPFRS